MARKVYSITDTKFLVKTSSQRSCIFEDTRLGMGMTYVYVYTLKFACSGLQSYKFEFLNMITLHTCGRYCRSRSKSQSLKDLYLHF